MKISHNWLKQYLETDLSTTAIAEILTNTGLEVEGVEAFTSVPGGLAGLVVGRIDSCEKHPDADRLSVCKVDVGADALLDIVCGAPNVAAEQKVVVATVGAKLYPIEGEPFAIKKSKIRGAVSEGMLCAEDEIGLGAGHDGIMLLPSDTKVGVAVAELFEVENDTVYEIGLTPNRSDAMCHIGVARDMAAALNASGKDKVAITVPSIIEPAPSNVLDIEVEIENQEACKRYSGVVLSNITVAPSPDWLRNRLLAIGIRPINNIVDITNYVLKEFGQPLHAFDYDKIQGKKVVVKTVTQGTPFVSLDGETRELSEQDLMICDAEKPMCIAGVFGGKDSGVRDTTTRIFLESAYFDSAFVRATSTRHGLRTEAATRYEKGADPHITLDALYRAVEWIEQLANGKVASSIIDVYPKEIPPNKVKLSLSRLNTLAGYTFSKEVVLSILKDLDINCTGEKEGVFDVEVPPYRADVLREADIIEEVLRIFGYNNIPVSKTVKSTLTFTEGKNIHDIREIAATRLNGLGYSEITTNSITKSAYYKEENRNSLVQLQNSMTAELDVMRASLVPDGMEVLAYNMNRKNKNLNLYEFGYTYQSDYSQNEVLALYQTGLQSDGNWTKKEEKGSFYGLKGCVAAIISALGIGDNLTEATIDNDQFSYGIQLQRNGKAIVELGAVSTSLLGAFEIEQPVFCALFDWKSVVKMVKKKKVKYTAIPKFPKVERDVAIIVKEEVAFADMKKWIEKSGGKMLSDVQLFDVYRDKEKIGVGLKSCALSFSLSSMDKTLTDKEIDKIFNKIMRTLEQELHAIIRK